MYSRPCLQAKRPRAVCEAASSSLSLCLFAWCMKTAAGLPRRGRYVGQGTALRAGAQHHGRLEAAIASPSHQNLHTHRLRPAIGLAVRHPV